MNKADVFTSLENLEHYIADFQLWVTSKLNEEKTNTCVYVCFCGFTTLLHVPEMPYLQSGNPLSALMI